MFYSTNGTCKTVTTSRALQMLIACKRDEANVPILYPLNTLENRKFSVVFRGCKMGTFIRNGLKLSPNK